MILVVLASALVAGVPPQGGRSDPGPPPGAAVSSRVVDLTPPVLLVAAESLVDPNFQKTVVLLLAHDDEGSVGLVLNHVSHVLNAEVGKKLNVRVPARAAGIAVREGGPVEPDRGFVLHERTDLAAERAIVKGVYVDPPERVLETVLKDGETRALLFVGYSGWGSGQLEGEVSRGDWSLAPVTSRTVFEVAPEDLWDALRREADSTRTKSALPAGRARKNVQQPRER